MNGVQKLAEVSFPNVNCYKVSSMHLAFIVFACLGIFKKSSEVRSLNGICVKIVCYEQLILPNVTGLNEIHEQTAMLP